MVSDLVTLLLATAHLAACEACQMHIFTVRWDRQHQQKQGALTTRGWGATCGPRGDGESELCPHPSFRKHSGPTGYLPVPLACCTEQRRDASPVGLGHGRSTLQQQLADLQLPPSCSGRQG